MAQNLLTNGGFESNPPNLNWQGPLELNSSIHNPGGQGGPAPEGANFGSTQAGGQNIVRVVNHAPVATSIVGATNLTFTGQWGGGTTCALQAGNCNSLSKVTAVMRVRDGDVNGTIVAEATQVMDHGTNNDPAIPSGFGWVAFSINGVASSGQATVQWGWADGNGQWSDGTGVHADALDLRESSTTQISLTSAVSEREHAAAGAFGLDLPLSGTPAIEAREDGSTPRMLLSFNGVPTATDGTINCGQEIQVSNGTCNSILTSGNTVTVNMTYGLNACVTVTVSGLTGLTGDSDVSVLTHRGNVNTDTSVNLLDLQEIKNVLFQPVFIINFTRDVNVDGLINLLDLQSVKTNLFQNASCP
jgi:hypothetical protein